MADWYNTYCIEASGLDKYGYVMGETGVDKFLTCIKDARSEVECTNYFIDIIDGLKFMLSVASLEEDAGIVERDIKMTKGVYECAMRIHYSSPKKKMQTIAKTCPGAPVKRKALFA